MAEPQDAQQATNAPTTEVEVGNQPSDSTVISSKDEAVTNPTTLFSTENFKIKIYNIHPRSAHSVGGNDSVSLSAAFFQLSSFIPYCFKLFIFSSSKLNRNYSH